MKKNINSRNKKRTIQALELETYLANVQEKADKISDKFVIMFGVLGLFFVPVYDTWAFTGANTVIIAALYLIARKILTNKFYARMIISLVYAIFMLQFIGQMHGMAEIHFFFFTNIAFLIIYQDWRIMIPYTIFAIGHHSVLAILQANAGDFGLENANLSNYFIGYSGRTIEGATVDYITTFQLMFHFGLAAMMAFVCGWWAVIFRNSSIQLMEKQFEQQTQNEELRSSEEEIRQNAEELQTTNDQMFVIQREIEEKQKLLNKAEKLVGLASYEIDLATQRLSHSDNLPHIYGENQLNDMQRVIEIAHPNDAHKVIETLTQAAEGKIKKYDISYRSKGSNLEEYRHYRAVGELVRDAMDNPEKLVGTVQDITEEVIQKQKVEDAYQKVQTSEEELRQNYEELQTIQEQLLLIQALIDNSQDAIQASRANGKFVYMNKVAGERFGIRSEECSRYSVQELEAIFKEKGDWEAHVEEVKKLGGLNIESENKNRTTGEIFPVEVGVRYVNINGEGYMMASSRDITERKKQEQEIKVKNEELQASEEELRQNYEELQTTQEQLEKQKIDAERQATYQKAILDNAGLMLIVTDTNGIITSFNSTAEKTLGYSDQEVIDIQSPALFHDINEIIKRAEELSQEFNENIEVGFGVFTYKTLKGLSDTHEWTYVKKNNEKFPISLTISAIRQNEEIIGFLGIAEDITERKKNEILIKKQNKELQASEEELQQNYEELQSIQEELYLQKERLEQIFDGVPAMIYQFKMTPDGQVSFPVVSKGSELVYGLPAQKIMDDADSIISPIHEADKLFFQNTVAKSAETLTNWNADIRVIIDGKIQWIRGSSKPIKYQDGTILWSGIVQEVTEQKELEQKVQDTNEELQASAEELRQNYEELQSAQNQLIQSEKMASLGQLVANIAHEINTPLGAIRSSSVSIEDILEKTLPTLPIFLKKIDNTALDIFNEFIKKSSQKTDTLSTREKRTIKYNLIDELEAMKIEGADKYADSIIDMNMQNEKDLFLPLVKNRDAEEILHTAYQLSTIIRSNQTVKVATDRAAKIVFALKNFARQDDTGEKATVNINESIETTLTLYHNQIKHGIDITRDFGKIPEFMGYPDELIQVWTNIIHNAIQAMKNKGRLFIQTSIEDNKVLVAIQDSGGGIPKKIQNRIFDAFFTTKGVGEGSGLGLDITRKIIEKHNGKIWFEALEGVGTTFFIELPIKSHK
ncbi:PAS domain S-box protein [Bernardetia sp. OM2101]|uniref:PAS domain S-box protein n=1 Tax=Bernardetia sp. OM2101 TaxID=3344876 RepID=UPI0035D06236